MTFPAHITAGSADRDAGLGSCVAFSSEDAMPQAGESPATSTHRTPSPGQQAVGCEGSLEEHLRATEHPRPAGKDRQQEREGHGPAGGRRAEEGGPPAPSRAAKRAPIPCRLFTADGVEVFVSQVCTRCQRMKPLAAFGLRRMPNGTIRSIPQCKLCRGGEPRDRRQVPMFPRQRKGAAFA